MNPLSIYIHVPFCTVKCSYCAFNVYTHLEHLVEPYVDAVGKEIEIVGRTNPGHPVHSIYFGGGTPTKLTAAQFERILAKIRDRFSITDDVEISTEANPEDLQHVQPILDLVQLGIKRLSIGVQSTHQEQLNLFGRLHDDHMVRSAVMNAREAGVQSVNLDLMYGVPYQTIEMWEETLDSTLQLLPDHLSLYALGIEKKTALDYWITSEKVPSPDDDLAADMYERASDMLAKYDYVQYELSNWAKEGQESRHNIQYWRNLPYVGIGPGAHGFAGGVRYVVEKSPHRYIKALAGSLSSTREFPLTPAVVEATPVDHKDEMSETIMMGLRLVREGLSLTQFQKRFGQEFMDGRQETVERYIQMGLLERNADILRLTDAGRFVSNHILADLI